MPLVGPTTRAPANVSCVGDGSPVLRDTGIGRGEARASQVPGPSSSYVPWSNTPPETPPSSPGRHLCKGVLLPSGKPGPSASGKTLSFGAACPCPTSSHAYASPPRVLGSSQGFLPAQAGSPLAGRVLHPLDGRRSFLKLSHPHSPSTRIAWSHWYA